MEEKDILLETFSKDPEGFDKTLVSVLLKKYNFDKNILLKLSEESMIDQVDFYLENEDFISEFYGGLLSIFPKKSNVKKYIEDVFRKNKNMTDKLKDIRNKFYIGKIMNVRELVEERETLKGKRKRTSTKDFEKSVEGFFEDLLFSDEMENEILFRTS